MIDNLGGIDRFVEGEVEIKRIAPFAFSCSSSADYFSLYCVYKGSIKKYPNKQKFGDNLIFTLEFYYFNNFKLSIDKISTETEISYQKCVESPIRRVLKTNGRINIISNYEICMAKIGIIEYRPI